MRPLSSNPSRGNGPTCRARLSKRGGTARHPGPYQDNIPVLVARDRKGATFDAVLPQDDSAAIAAAPTGVVTSGNHLVGDGGKPLAAFAQGQNSLPCRAIAWKADPRGTSPAH